MEAPPTSGTSGSGTTTMQHLNLDPATLIVPEAIPIPGTAPEALADAASGTSSSGAGIESAGQDIRSVWQALAGVYTAPESDQLLRAANPIADLGSEIGGTMAAAAGALQKFSEEADRLKGQLLELRGTAQEFVDGLDDDWNNDSDTVDENVNLKVQANRLVTSFQEAERECANAITSLFGGTTFVPVGSNPHNEEGIIEYGVTMDADVNQVPEYNTFVVSDTGSWLEGYARGWWESAGPGFAKNVGLTLAASQGFYHPENGWTLDPEEAQANRFGFTMNTLMDLGTKGGNSIGIEFRDGTLIPSRWGVDVIGKHYTEQAHEFFPWTELDDDPGHAFGVGVGNLGVTVASAVGGRALMGGRLASVAPNGGGKSPDVPDGEKGSEQPQPKGGAKTGTPGTPGGQPQGGNGSTSTSSDSGPVAGQERGSENLKETVNQLDNKIENSQTKDPQPQNPQPQAEEAKGGAPQATQTPSHAPQPESGGSAADSTGGSGRTGPASDSASVGGSETPHRADTSQHTAVTSEAPPGQGDRGTVEVGPELGAESHRSPPEPHTSGVEGTISGGKESDFPPRDSVTEHDSVEAETSTETARAAEADTPLSEGASSDQQNQNRVDVEAEQRAHSSDPLAARLDDTVTAYDADRFVQIYNAKGDLLEAMKQEAREAKADEARHREFFDQHAQENAQTSSRGEVLTGVRASGGAGSDLNVTGGERGYGSRIQERHGEGGGGEWDEHKVFGEDPENLPGVIRADGVRYFESNSSGEDYGEEVLGDPAKNPNAYENLPANERNAVYHYTILNWMNPLARAGSASRAMEWIDHWMKKYDEWQIYEMNGRRTPSIDDIYRASHRSDLNPVQRDLVNEIINDVDDVGKLEEIKKASWPLHKMTESFGGRFPSDAELENALRGRVIEMDSATRKPLPEKLQAVREVRNVAFMEGFDGLKIESLIDTVQVERGYLSTSLGKTPPLIATDGSRVRIRFTIPEGAEGLWMGRDSHYPHQRELILPRGTSYHIKYVYTGLDGYTYIDADVTGRLDLPF